MPISLSIQRIVDQFRKVTVAKGQSTVLFDDPEGGFLGQNEVIKQFNSYLAENPDYILPEGYEKKPQEI